jgi:hypothetical protein
VEELNRALLIVSAIAAAAAVFAAGFAWWAAYETRQTSQAQIASELLNEYGSESMRASVITLINFAHGHGIDFAEDYRAKKFHVAFPQSKLEPARRQVAHYFQKIAILAHHKLIDENLLKSVVSHSQVDIAVTYLEPLEVILASRVTPSINPHWTYDILRRLHPPPYPGYPDPPPAELGDDLVAW